MIQCAGCEKTPIELYDEEILALDGYESADDYAREDGTYNISNGHFYCDACYIEADMPLGVAP
jgi:hypothetical protein